MTQPEPALFKPDVLNRRTLTCPFITPQAGICFARELQRFSIVFQGLNLGFFMEKIVYFLRHGVADAIHLFKLIDPGAGHLLRRSKI